MTPAPPVGERRPDPADAPWDDPEDWTPWRVGPGPEGPVVEWFHSAGLAFDDPFSQQTVQRAFAHPFRLLFTHRTALARIEADAHRAASLPIAGVVLHMSRCGSTLVSQVLGSLSSVLAVSEPGPVDDVLRLARAAHRLPDGSVVGPDHVRAMVDAVARPRDPGQTACVVKLDAWTVADLPLLRAALPGVPWVFVHRDGAAVLASHRRVRGAHVLPGVLAGPWPAWDPGVEPGLGVDEHAARVLGALCDAAADHAGPDGRFVDHADLPGAVAEVVAPHFGLDLDAADRTAMAAAGERDAKNPRLLHVRPEPPSADLVALAARWIEPARRRLITHAQR
ncbi:hypothetical protein HC251_05065 [Iamia sp. SCSIO 61187]|uniref:hypothetical protein n=1 Tax=Iamia sp. SCSIO 61187 TaxID=2722752 RepID=UPI001C6371CF|nr:hypothetical protein [Iamia sp. SCSIO 61187]QYG91870.1 hypothetical protein HC251_05065 [Iamia sp. SCSIO 61187]